MFCLNCSSAKTIKAHLIPKVFTKEVTVGSAHAIVSPKMSTGFDPHSAVSSIQGFYAQPATIASGRSKTTQAGRCNRYGKKPHTRR